MGQSRWRSQACSRESGPGPGAYQTERCPSTSLYAESAKFSFAGKGYDKVDDGPGPGHYGTGSRGQPRFTPRNKPGFNFGTSQREPGQTVSTPGPGQYACKTSMGASGPSYSLMAKREYLECKDIGPGPGAHDLHPAFGE